MHLSFVGFPLSSRNTSLTTILYLVHWLPPVLHVIYMQYILHDCTLPVCIIICTQKYNMYRAAWPMYNYEYRYSHTTQCTHEYESIHIMRRQWHGRVLMKNHPFTLAMNITILAICTLLCICVGGRGVCKLVYHHIPNIKLTQRDDNIIASRIAISYLHTDTRESVLQYYVSCKGLNVTATIHTAHAQKYFSPETIESASKKKIRQARPRHHRTWICDPWLVRPPVYFDPARVGCGGC